MGNHNSRKKITYKIPPGAGKPQAPSKPTVEYIGEDVMVRWSEPNFNGGCPVIGYILQFNRVDGNTWESFRVNGTECLLKNLDDTFVFRVVAENLLGYSEPSETSVPVSFEFSEPVLLVPLNNMNRAIEFEKVELSCRIWGMPIPDIQWYLNGDEILANERIYMLSDGIDYKLIFNHIKISDIGEICARGRNFLGEIESTAQIIVEAPPRIKVPRKYEDGVICRGGESLRLKFGCTGRPKPSITFYHDGEPIQGQHKTQEIGDIAVLTLENMTREDGGEYSIRVENSIGEDIAHVLVTVTDRPHPPKKPFVILLSDNSCLLEWEQSSDDVNTYIVEYFRDGWGVWLKALSTKSRQQKTKQKVCHLIPGSNYRFRLRAENHFGISDGGEQSDQVYIPMDRSSSIMSSIQEDEFEVVNDNLSNQHIPDDTNLKVSPKPNTTSLKSEIKRDVGSTDVRSRVVKNEPVFKLSENPSHNLSPVSSAAQEKERTNFLDRVTQKPKSTRHEFLATEEKQVKREQPSLINRNQIIGGVRSPNSQPSRLPQQQQQQQKKDEVNMTAPGNVSDSKDRYFEQYSKPVKATRGQDRFAKYRNDSKMDYNSGSPSPTNILDSNKELGTGDSEPYQVESSFLIVEDGSEEEEDEESVDCVVSQLVVPVKNGNVKISTSFDSGSMCASSVKSSTDDLSFDFLTRNNTPDVLLNEMMTPGDRDKEWEGGSRVNLLQSFAEFTNVNKRRGGGNDKQTSTAGVRVGVTPPGLMRDNDDDDQDNEFFIRSFRHKTRDSRIGRGGTEEEFDMSQYTSIHEGGGGSYLNMKDTTKLSENRTENVMSDESNDNGGGGGVSLIKSRISNVIDAVVVLSFFALLSPLSFMNLYTFVLLLFSLLLIKRLM